MSEQVSCARCNAIVARSATVYSATGALLCNRCHQLELAHEHVERARQAALAEAAREVQGPASLIASAIAGAQADAEARELHQIVDAMGVLPATPAPATLDCSRCQAAVPHAETSYSAEGRPLCAACAARVDLELAGRTDSSGRWIGWAVAALCCGVVAVVVVAYLLHGR